uniref:FAM20A golgi associated secretory pathway pseudokinase n=1 Tax=Callorhinchus milii TaxID=7868 RepID=A0A4W3KGE8_CALMI
LPRLRDRSRFFIILALSVAFTVDLLFHILPQLYQRSIRSQCTCDEPSRQSAAPRSWGSSHQAGGRSGAAQTQILSQDSGPFKLRKLFSHPFYQTQRTPSDQLLRRKDAVKYYSYKAKRNNRQRKKAQEENITAPYYSSRVYLNSNWLKFQLAIDRDALYPRSDPLIDHHTADEKALNGKCDCKKVVKPSGIQLKILLKFQNFGKATFKPMKQKREEETPEDVFYFVDIQRHNAEIAAFHLDRILDFRRVPPVAGRRLNVSKEIRDLTRNEDLKSTFFVSPANNVCFFARCPYMCKTEYAVCGNPDLLEGSISAFLPDLYLAPREFIPHPWKRSYTFAEREEWETNPRYCEKIKHTPPYDRGTRLLDIIDMAIFDFLTGNMDRHHYEVFARFAKDGHIIHFDNARGFGKHSHDELSILAPLAQCCRVKKSTLFRLQLLTQEDYRLSDMMRESLLGDRLAPVVTEPHLLALDRRLRVILDTVQKCVRKHGQEDVIENDMGHVFDGVNLNSTSTSR